jgi:hypothetical protein
MAEYILILGLLGGAFILSFNRSALNPSHDSDKT